MFMKKLQTRGVLESIGNTSVFARWLSENSGGDNSSGVLVNAETAMSLPYAYAAINVLAQTVAHVPLELMKKTPKGNTSAVNHPLYNLLKSEPSTSSTSYQWRQTIEGHRNGWGNGYAAIIRENAVPVDLPLLRPDQTEIKKLNTGDIVYITVLENGQKVTIPSNDILHFAGLGYDGVRGYSPIHMARESIGLGIAMHKFGGRFFKNGATMKGIIESEIPANTLGPFAEEFKKQYGGLDQAHGTPILPKGLTYKSTMVNPDDAQTLETLKFNRTEIAALYRVPPQFIMDLERSTFTNAVEMDLHFIKHTMIPIYTNYEAEMDKKLLTISERRRGYYFKFNVNGLLRGAQKDRYSAYHIALQDGWLNRNEVRTLEDRELVDGLDEYLVPVNMMTVSDSEQQEDEITEDPIVESVADRMASNERRTLERLGENVSKVSAFYEDYPKFIRKLMLPVAKMVRNELDISPNEFVERFISAHIEKQLNQMVNRVGDLVVTETAIIETYREVKNDAIRTKI